MTKRSVEIHGHLPCALTAARSTAKVSTLAYASFFFVVSQSISDLRLAQHVDVNPIL